MQVSSLSSVLVTLLEKQLKLLEKTAVAFAYSSILHTMDLHVHMFVKRSVK